MNKYFTFAIFLTLYNVRTLYFFFFNWRLITLQHCGCLCHTFTWIRHACTCVPHPEPPSHLSPHPVPQGHPSAPALSTLSHVSNLDWWSISHMTEDEMVGWHHRLNGLGFGWTPGVDEGQGGLAYWSSWGRKESDPTERLNWTEYTCFNAILSNHPILAFSHRVQKSVLYICVSFAVSHIGSSLPSF